MRPTDIACAFYKHRSLEESECIEVCDRVADVLHVIGHSAEEEEAALRSSTSCAGCPTVLPNSLSTLAHSESLSMMASYAEYTIHTRCHAADGLSEGRANLLWKHAVSSAAATIFGTNCCAPRRKGLIMGVYIMRGPSDLFSVGIVTQGSMRDPRVRRAVTMLCGAHKLTQLDAQLPICEAYRSMSVRLWWEPRSDRVTPHAIMPPIRVILEREQHEASESYMTGYGAVNIFLCRPIGSKLLGTTRKWMGPGGCHSIDNAPVRFDGNGFASHAKQIPQRRKQAAVLCFRDLRVVEVGEHLVGVEVEPSPAFRAFVPSQYSHLPPFLVVAQNNA